MGNIYLKLRRRRDTLDNIDASKFLGDPAVPAELDADRVLGDDEIFLCQLDCAAVKACDPSAPVPSAGWLWFFVDLDEYPYKGRVIYSKWGPEFVLEEYNEEWVEDTTRAWGVKFSTAAKDDCGAVIPADSGEGAVVLLRLDPEKADLGVLAGAGGVLSFVVERDAFDRCDFSAARLQIG